MNSSRGTHAPTAVANEKKKKKRGPEIRKKNPGTSGGHFYRGGHDVPQGAEARADASQGGSRRSGKNRGSRPGAEGGGGG